MSKKTTKPESAKKGKIHSNNFELSNADTSVMSPHAEDGFALWMLTPSLWLPTTIGGFIRFLIFIAVLVLGSTVNIYLSAQISEAQLDQAQLEEEYRLIQRENAQIAWQIAEHTALDQIRQRAVNIGYIGAPRRSYAFSPISDETLATIDETILKGDNLVENGRRPTALSKAAGRLAANSVPDLELNLDRSGTLGQGQEAILAANISANRLIENGLLEAVKVIDGR